MHRIKLLLALFLMTNAVNAQELNARVTVVSSRVANNVNKNTFQTLQTALNNFLNNRKWSPDVYAPNEKDRLQFPAES